MKTFEGKLTYDGKSKVGIVLGKFNDFIGDKLLEGTLHGLRKYEVPEENIVLAKVPGAFEIPLATKKLIDDGCKAVITLGVIIKGETKHFKYVCKEAADGIMRVQLDSGVPVIFEVLMVKDTEDAVNRAVVPENPDGDWTKNKGYIAALNALEMIDLMVQ